MFRHLAALGAILAAAVPAAASPWDDVPPPAPHPTALALEPAVSMSHGDFGDIAGIGVGASLRFELAVHRHVSLIARGGFVFHLIKNEINTTEVLGLAGVRVAIRERSPSEFFWIEGGYDYLRANPDLPRDAPTETAHEIGFGGGVGYEAGRVDVRVGYWLPSITEPDFGGSFTASFGFRFLTL